MKRFLLLVIVWIAGISVVSAQLSNTQIDEISQSVVSIGVIGTSGEIEWTGSGTIVSSTGLIYTNRHVAEDGQDYVIYLLEDPNELPVHRYYASLVGMFEDFDFAILQIDRNERGGIVIPTSLNLPFIEPTPVPVTRGETVYVFGYPGIGNGYLVLTNGSITTIQNGEVAGERMPVWYQTDAEIAPGNSGGLAVNAQGQLVGIPTAVDSEDRTGGRLGGILPFSAVMALAESGEGLKVPNVANNSNTTPATNQAFSIEITDLTYDVEVDGQLGIAVHTRILAEGYLDTELRVATFFYWNDDTAVTANDDNYSTPSGYLTVQEVIIPSYDNSEWADYQFWLPYTAFPLGLSGLQEGYVVADIAVNGETLESPSNTWPFSLQYGDNASNNSNSNSNTPADDMASATCSDGTSITNGVEISVVQMRPGFTYSATVLGVNGTDAVLAVRDSVNTSDILCADDSPDAGAYAVNLPSTGLIQASRTNPRLRFSHSNNDLTDISLVVGAFGGTSGEFVVILEGMAITPADNLGDPFRVNINSGMINSGVPLSVYMIGAERQLDPIIYIFNTASDPVLLDNSGNAIICDDGGTAACWNTGYSMEGYFVQNASSGYASDSADSVLVIDPSNLSPQSFIYMMSSYQGQSTGNYIIVFHFGIR